MDESTETMTISNRSDFAQWAIERAERIAETANALGQAIVDALLEVFDGLISGD